MNKKTRQHRKDHEPDIRLGHTALTGVDTGKGVAATDVGLGSEHHQPRHLGKEPDALQGQTQRTISLINNTVRK